MENIPGEDILLGYDDEKDDPFNPLATCVLDDGDE